MKFNIQIEHTIEIPDEEIRKLLPRVRQRFEMPTDALVHPHDIVHQAVIDGLIDEPGELWTTLDEDSIAETDLDEPATTEDKETGQ